MISESLYSSFPAVNTWVCYFRKLETNRQRLLVRVPYHNTSDSYSNVSNDEEFTVKKLTDGLVTGLKVKAKKDTLY